MEICWYCYWGWAKPVAEIYKQAVEKLGGCDHSLMFGPAHIVWSDDNFEDGCIKYCLDNFDKNSEFTVKEDLPVVRWSLEELLKVPESVRCCEPVEYNGENPENYPPAVEVEVCT